MVLILIGISWAESNIPAPADASSLIPRYGGYFDFISYIALMFAAYVGPELFIPDRTQGVLNIYFSRPLSLPRYLLAKQAAYAAIILSFWLAPQLILHIGFGGAVR